MSFRAILVMALAVFAYSADVYAFTNPPILIPAHPQAGQNISVSVTAGACDAMGGAPAQVTVQGNNISVLLQSLHSVDSEFCTYPTITGTYPIGAFTAGSYTTQIDRTYIGANGPVTENIGTIAFAVGAIAMTPSLNPTGLCLLVAAILGVAWLARRRSRRNCHASMTSDPTCRTHETLRPCRTPLRVHLPHSERGIQK